MYSLLEYLFNKFAFLKVSNFIKKRFQQRCFPLKFVKFLRTAFLQNTSGSCFWRTVLSVRSRSRSRNAFWKFFMCLSRWCWIDFGLLLELNNNDTRTTLLHGFMLFYGVFLVIFFVLQSLLLALNRFLPVEK